MHAVIGQNESEQTQCSRLWSKGCLWEMAVLQSLETYKPGGRLSHSSRATVHNTDIFLRAVPESQRNNLLLRLPAELRNRIYELVFRGKTYLFKSSIHTKHARLDTTEKHIFGLLYVCRQIYFEAALLPYAMNTFCFHDFETSLYPFLRDRSPAQFRSIQSLELVTYQASM